VVCPTLNAFDMGATRATVLIFDTGSHGDGIRISDTTVPTLNARMGTGGNNTPMTNQGTIVRRLTPTECERLQGFPDGWTDGQADSHRYKQMGNAVAVPVVEWIFDRLVRLDKEQA
jgi:DNA (cytosine-5)-methyltransferase 1